MDRRKASKAPLVQTSLSLLPCSTHWEPQRQGQSGSSSALSPPDTGRNQTQASQTLMGTCNKRSSHPTTSTPQGNSHLVTPSAPLLLPPPLHSLHYPVLPCATRSPPLCHGQMPSPSSLIKPHAGPGIPPTLPLRLPKRRLNVWLPSSDSQVVATASVVQDPQLPSLSLHLTSSARDMNHQVRQHRPLKYIFYQIPCACHGGLAVFVCSTLRFLPHPDVLYLQLVAHLTWQADVGL